MKKKGELAYIIILYIAMWLLPRLFDTAIVGFAIINDHFKQRVDLLIYHS